MNCKPPIPTGLAHLSATFLPSLVGQISGTSPSSRCKRENKVSRLRRQNDIVHKQRVNAGLAECDDRVGGRADDWLAVVEGRIDDERHAGSRKEAGQELVKAPI